MTENPSPPSQSPGAQDKLIGIELLRFASAVAVLIFHFQHFAFVGTAPHVFTASRQPFYPVLHLLYVYGFYGVQVFWCISGFIFFWKYADVISKRRLSGYKFFVLRMSRLYPLHFATLLFVAALQAVYFAKNGFYFIYASNDFYHFMLQLFMASNWGLQVGDSYNGPIWSISIEVLVYCIFFLTLRYISGSPVMVACMAALSAGVMFLKISVSPVFNCLLFFYLGCMTAYVYMRIKDVASYREPAAAVAVVAIAAVVSAQYFVSVTPIYFLLIFSPALIYLCVEYIPATRVISAALNSAGSVTYSSYLLHVPIQLTVAAVGAYARWPIPVYSRVFFMSYLAGTLLLSRYCYKYFEMPAQNYLRRRLAREHQPGARRNSGSCATASRTSS